jgi:hypothetical protein
MTDDTSDTTPTTDDDVYYAILLARAKGAYNRETTDAGTCG